MTGGDPVDTGLSRISAGVVGVGNGTAASLSGTLKANQVWGTSTNAAHPAIAFAVAGDSETGWAGRNVDIFACLGGGNVWSVSYLGHTKQHVNGVHSWIADYDIPSSVADTGLSRISAGVVGVGNGTAASVTGTLQAATVTVGAGSEATASLAVGTSGGFYQPNLGHINVTQGGFNRFGFRNDSTLTGRASARFAWAADDLSSGDPADTGLSRTAAGTVAVGNGTAGNASGTLNAAAVNLTGALAGTTATLTAAGTTGTVADVLLVSRTPFSATGTGARLYLSGSNNITRAAYIEGVNTTGSGGGHDLVFGTNVSTSAPVERMRITSGGNVAFTGTVLAPGAQIQLVSTQTGAVATGTTVLPYDDTIPQIGEGTEFMTLAITPKSATSTLVIEVTTLLSNSAAGVNTLAAALFQDSTANALAAMIGVVNAANHVVTVSFSHTVTSGSTTARTYRVRCGSNVAGTTTFNGAASARVMGGVLASSIVIREVAV